MRPALRALAAALPLLAALACGGRTDGIGGDGGGACPPPSSVVQGASCSASGQSCPTGATTCNGAPETCACENGTFLCGADPITCPVPCGDCADAQPPTCPGPANIHPGGACAVAPDVSCQSAEPIYGCGGDVEGYVSCFCESGGWICADPGPPACADVSPPPPACPDPTAVEQGVSCFAEGEQCPGRPTECGGQILYDAFQCTAGTWDDIATTICDVDASTGEGGASVDAGIVDAAGGG